MESFVSLRNYLEHGSRSTDDVNNASAIDSRTLSTTTDETVGYSTNVCAEDLCHVFDSLADFDHVTPPTRQNDPPAVASRGSQDIEENVQEQPTPNTRSSLDDRDDPVPGGSTLVPKVQSTKSTKSYPHESKTHFRLWGHGKLWTLVALVCAWTSCGCAVWCRYNTYFVGLTHPITIGSGMYQPIKRVGIIRVEVCYNETISNRSGCEIIRLSPTEIKDPMFNVSRSLLTMATCLGVALTFILTTTIAWESVNLRPVGFAFLITYFFQSFSMLFFDTNLCHEHGCTMATGGILCIISSVLWVATIVAVAKMDSFKIRAIRGRRKEARRKLRRERREIRRLRELGVQVGTPRSNSGSPTVHTNVSGSPRSGSLK